jgi:mycothiol synthase
VLNIRRFKKGFDEDNFISIFNASFGDYDDIRSLTPEEMRKMEESPGFSTDGMFIAEWNGEIAGMVNAYVDKLREEKKGFIQWLGVLPKFRRKGIARKLVEKALESLRQRGMETVETWTQTDREACIKLFGSFGFKPARMTSMMKRSLKNITSDIGENLEVKIRKVRLEDEEDIRLLNWLDNETFKEHFNFRPRTIEETKYTLFETPWFKPQEWLFATQHNQTIGYIGFGIDEGLNKEKSLSWGWILDIGVLKPHRRRGIATRLMFHAMQALRASGLEEVLLYVDDINPTNAIKLYQNLGFTTMRKNFVSQLSLSQQP